MSQSSSCFMLKLKAGGMWWLCPLPPAPGVQQSPSREGGLLARKQVGSRYGYEMTCTHICAWMAGQL